MDRTLKRAKRNNKRRGQRNHGAWQRFSPDGKTCRYCEHDGSQHLCRSGQPHFYRPATEAERRDPSVMLYRHTPVSSTGQALPDGGSMLVRRMTVAARAELITAFCVGVRREHRHPSGALFPAQPGYRRGNRHRHSPQGPGNRRLKRHEKGETT